MQTCLVIDEFSVVRKVAARILTLAGYAVQSAQSLTEAGERMDGTERIDIVIVSATLPDCTVEEAIRLVRGHPKGASATILASLVEANLGTMTRAKRAGASGFVFRPFDRDALTGWLAEHVREQESPAVA